MAMENKKRVLFVIAPANFRDEELFDTKEALESENTETIIASKKIGVITGSKGGAATATIALNKVNIPEFDAIIFIGGHGAEEYFNDKVAHKIAKEAASNGKVIGAICCASSILANAGLLLGKNATSNKEQAQNLTAKGANFTGQSVTIDGKIVTATLPADSKQFGKEIAKLLQAN